LPSWFTRQGVASRKASVHSDLHKSLGCSGERLVGFRLSLTRRSIGRCTGWWNVSGRDTGRRCDQTETGCKGFAVHWFTILTMSWYKISFSTDQVMKNEHLEALMRFSRETTARTITPGLTLFSRHGDLAEATYYLPAVAEIAIPEFLRDYRAQIIEKPPKESLGVASGSWDDIDYRFPGPG
jgi:hypothetical protein